MGGRAAAEPHEVSTRTLVGIVAAAAAVLVVIAAALLPLRPGRSVATASRPLAVRAAFVPAAVAFGDSVTARIVVTLDAHAVRPSSLRLVYAIAPLTQLGRVVQRRATRGGQTVVIHELRAACLVEICSAASGRRSVAAGTVRAGAARNRGGRVNATVAWSPLTVASRVSAADLTRASPPFRATVTPPTASYRMRPALLAALLDGAAAILAACGAGLAAAALLRARRPLRDEHPDELTRALLLARSARTRPEPDRRAAAGYLARLLARRDAPLARTADDLAWSRPSPTANSLTELVEDVEREGRA